ncbi:TIGR01459 family HAD-type hydrolase [Nereida sp. MMG025]|uniref:TIGR01459 family HAD-type hydrolase n=1 Tax=Nereida sp. MMG025 TaxID=2909981 RepID=UPI001F2607F0|nr:TIGR01459 family HAD-type hydrolase [Nereida sp. MMG025]MCF6444099.1 TIGR01459 family HAD-type hydrolase [Nereida sp. MMG025]
MTKIITALSEVSDRYDALFCDLWGCVHNGIAPFKDAVNALLAFKETGGTVILVTNAPRPRASVATQLERMGLPRACYDDIATSGDSARTAMFQGAVGQKVWFIGEDHDQSFFKPLQIIDDPLEITQVSLDDAEGIVCCGPFDPHADPSDMRPEFLAAKQRGLKLLCANPDIVVDRGESREWCAGALAALYTEMGGDSLYFGKPHPPIYDLARRRLAAIRPDTPDSRILAVGDGIGTDVKGAMGEDIDSLFITGGLAAAETKTSHQPDADALSAYLQREMSNPSYAIGFFR